MCKVRHSEHRQRAEASCLEARPLIARCGMVWEVRDGVGWRGMVRDGVGWRGMVRDGAGWRGRAVPIWTSAALPSVLSLSRNTFVPDLAMVPRLDTTCDAK